MVANGIMVSGWSKAAKGQWQAGQKTTENGGSSWLGAMELERERRVICVVWVCLKFSYDSSDLLSL